MLPPCGSAKLLLSRTARQPAGSRGSAGASPSQVLLRRTPRGNHRALHFTWSLFRRRRRGRKREAFSLVVSGLLKMAATNVLFPGGKLDLRQMKTSGDSSHGRQPDFNPGIQSLFYSHDFVLKPSEAAFSLTARLIWSDAPDGNSALISSVMLKDAFGSAARMLMISSAI